MLYALNCWTFDSFCPSCSHLVHCRAQQELLQHARAPPCHAASTVKSRLEIKHGGAVVGELFRCCVLGEIVMSGRGRGKSFGNLEAIGIKPGDRIPPPILQPPPLYSPRLRVRRLGLSQTDHDLLCIKQKPRQFLRQSPFLLKSEKRNF